MSENPTLSDMGIVRFHEIRDYSFYSEKDVDVLKIYYKRKEGSLLPRRKVFKFPKRSRSFPGTSSQDSVQQISEPSPTILKAVKELQELLEGNKNSVDKKAQILKRLEQLESEVQSNVAELRSLLSAID